MPSQRVHNILRSFLRDIFNCEVARDYCARVEFLLDFFFSSFSSARIVWKSSIEWGFVLLSAICIFAWYNCEWVHEYEHPNGSISSTLRAQECRLFYFSSALWAIKINSSPFKTVTKREKVGLFFHLLAGTISIFLIDIVTREYTLE